MGHDRRQAAATLLLVLLVTVAPAAALFAGDGDFAKHIRHLASDQLRGRGNSRPEINDAARYIEDRFREYGLLPAVDGKSYFQVFEAETGIRLGPRGRLVLEIGQERAELVAGRDYLPVALAAVGEVRAPLAFAGYGITAPELDYDDYRDFDVRGKIVAVYQHEPQENVSSSRFAGTQLTPYSTLTYKVMNARSRGAAGLILLNDPACERERNLGRELRCQNVGLDAVKLSEKWTAWLLGHSGHARRTTFPASSVHVTLQPFDFPDSRVTMALDVDRQRHPLKNVLGVVPGQSEEWIIVGAHYDHLGLGEKRSMAPDQIGEVHNGADDNASGVAGLLHLAQSLARSRPPRGLLFAAFAGEELGLLGSRHYVEDPLVPLAKTSAMLNLDMIGRSSGSLFIGGVGTTVEFRALLDRLQTASPLEFKYTETPEATSDHLAFSEKRIPVLLFFTGLHNDYHRPSDDWQKIDLVRAGRVVEVVRGMIQSLGQLASRLQYVDLETAALTFGGALRVNQFLFGLTLDVAWELEGAHVVQVQEGTPAARAGLQVGDVILGVDGAMILNNSDLVQALLTKKSGDVVQLGVLRNSRMVTTRITLNKREPEQPTGVP